MILAIPLAWRQLMNEKRRLAVALAGVAFAVVLIFMQLGFRSSLFQSAIRYHQRFDYDLVLVSPKTPFLVLPQSFTRRRLYQALGAPEIASGTALYLHLASWKNPWDFGTHDIFVVGFDPTRPALRIDGVRESQEALRLPDVALFDALSRPEYGPVPDAVRRNGPVTVEVNDRKIQVTGLFELGTSFGINGSLVTSDLNFLRLFPQRDAGRIDLALLKTRPGADPAQARDHLAALLEADVLVLTRADFIAREIRYWDATTPIGYVFAFGSLIGLVVGGIIVYQILFADVSDHLAEYATLKAMGYRNRDLALVVLQEAALLGILGFVPGAAIAAALYSITADATQLPLEFTAARAGLVLSLTVVMCAVAGLIALRKVRSADPAEVF